MSFNGSMIKSNFVCIMTNTNNISSTYLNIIFCLAEKNSNQLPLNVFQTTLYTIRTYYFHTIIKQIFSRKKNQISFRYCTILYYNSIWYKRIFYYLNRYDTKRTNKF